MHLKRSLWAVALISSLLAGCMTAGQGPPPPPPPRPAAFVPLGISAPYLSADVLGGRKARAAKMKAAGIKGLSPYEAGTYLSREGLEFRQQTAGIGVDVLPIGDSLLVRIPAALTFNSNSAELRPQFEGTLTEVARTLKAHPETYVDVFAHTDTSGAPEYNKSLSEKRAAAVAAFFAGHGVAKARIASRGYGETTPLYFPDDTPDKQAANRRVEIRVVPFRATDVGPVTTRPSAVRRKRS